MSEITEDQLRQIIKDSIGPLKTYPSQTALAKAMGKSKQYINDIILRGKPISDNVATFFGYKLVKIYSDRGQS